MIPPGATIGIIGGGQLGRMLAMAAAQLGYSTHIYAPEASGPAMDVAGRWTQGDYTDRAALEAFAAQCAVITYEFENIPVGPVSALVNRYIVHPHPKALEVGQDRLIEKDFVRSLGGASTPYKAVDSADQLDAALEEVGLPAILKTRRLGYDGKGQAIVRHRSEAPEAFRQIATQPAILERFLSFDHEFSVLLVRAENGEMRVYDSAKNVHVGGILDRSLVPVPDAIEPQVAAARALTARIADALDYVGVIACEFFATDAGPVFNEMAPRVHNSGHWTIEGAVTSQFENHIRAICGLPLGSTARTGPRVVMHNIIGNAASDWPEFLANPDCHLHLYGKIQARPGRKMGHATWIVFDEDDITPVPFATAEATA